MRRVGDRFGLDCVQHHLPVERSVGGSAGSLDDLDCPVAKGERAFRDGSGGDYELYVAHRRRKYIARVTLRDFHADWAWVVVASNGLVGLWATGAHWWAPLRQRVLWWCVVAAEVTAVVQVGMGVWLLSIEGVSAPKFHTFYGFVTLFAVLILYAYRNQLRANMFLLYGGGSLFLMGLGLRSIVLA